MEDRVEIFGRNYQFITPHQAEVFEDFRMLSFTGQIDANTCEKQCYESFFGRDYENQGGKEDISGLIKRFYGRDTGVFWIVNHFRKSITYDGLRSMKLAESLKHIVDDEYPFLLSKSEFDSINKKYSKYFNLNSVNLNKKIIGYTLKKEKYQLMSAVNAITGWKPTESHSMNTFLISLNLSSIKKLTDAGVLSIWFDPLYEEEFKEIEVGVDKVIVKVYKDKVIFGVEEFSMKSISDMHKTFHDMYLTPEKNSTHINPHQIQVLEFKIGCTKFKMEDMQKVIRTSKELIHGL